MSSSSYVNMYFPFRIRTTFIISLLFCFTLNIQAQRLGAHPGYDIESFNLSGWNEGITGMDWMPDGESMVVVTYRGTMDKPGYQISGSKLDRSEYGSVYIIENVKDPRSAKVTKIFDKILDALGVLVHNGEIFIPDQDRLIKLVDKGNGNYEDETFAEISTGDGWYEYSFGPLAPGDGYLYVGNSNHTDPPVGYLAEQDGEDRGTILRIPEEGGDWEVYATGIRMPDGMALGPKNEIVVAENQGIWRPASCIQVIRPDKFYGYAHSVAEREQLEAEHGVTPPAIWIPYKDPKVNAAPTELVLMKSGRFEGQFIFGDWGNQNALYRADLDPIKDENGEDTYQGSVFNLMGGFSGFPHRIRVDEETNDMYVGHCMLTMGPSGGPQKVVAKPDVEVFEMLAIRARKGGYEIEFTLPVGDISAGDIKMRQWEFNFDYTRTKYYNDPTAENLSHGDVQISDDKTRVFVAMDNIETPRMVEFSLASGVKSESGKSLLHRDGWYTINWLNNMPFEPGAVGISDKAKSDISSGVSLNGSLQFEWTSNYSTLFIYSVDGAILASYNVTGRTEFQVPNSLNYKGLGFVQLKGNGVSSTSKALF